MFITKKTTLVTKQYMKCFDIGLANIPPSSNLKAHKKHARDARREFKNFLEKGMSIEDALKESLIIASGGENTRYLAGINIALSHVPSSEPYLVRLYHRIFDKIFSDRNPEISSGYKFPSKI